MILAFGLRSIASLFRPHPAPTQTQLDHQVATGGGSEVARDNLVKNDRCAKSMRAVGAGVAKKSMLARNGVTKPGAAKKR